MTEMPPALTTVIEDAIYRDEAIDPHVLAQAMDNIIATHLSGVAAKLDEVPTSAVARLFVEAAKTIEALRILMEEKLKILDEQEEANLEVPGIPSQFVEDARHMIEHADLFSKAEVLVMLAAAAEMIETLAESAGSVSLADLEPEGSA